MPSISTLFRLESHLTAEGSVRKRLLQLVERREFALVDGFETLDSRISIGRYPIAEPNMAIQSVAGSGRRSFLRTRVVSVVCPS